MKVTKKVSQLRKLLTVACCSENTVEPHYQVREMYRQSLLYLLPLSYLELALNGPLDGETREHLNQSHAASKVGDRIRLTPTLAHLKTRVYFSPSTICWISHG